MLDVVLLQLEAARPLVTERGRARSRFQRWHGDALVREWPAG
jgi:hypothetical protein